MSRIFHENADTYEQPPTVAERADDERYSNDFAVLVALFRIDLEGKTPPTVQQFARQLNRLSLDLLNTSGVSADGLFFEESFNTHGPSVLLRALARAYDAPEHVLTDLVGD